MNQNQNIIQHNIHTCVIFNKCNQTLTCAILIKQSTKVINSIRHMGRDATKGTLRRENQN